MNVIFGNYGNDTLALIQWAFNRNLPNTTVISVNTGWAAQDWDCHVKNAQDFVRRCGFRVVELHSEMTFAQLVKQRQNFPSTKFHWCANFLKGLTLLDWLDNNDPFAEAVILIAKWGGVSKPARVVPEYVEKHELYDDRKVWYPLFQHGLAQRDELLKQSGFRIMKHRSLECDPCIYNQRRDFDEIHLVNEKRVAKLEAEVDKLMFAPDQYGGSKGIEQVVKWVKNHSDKVSNEDGGNGERDAYYKGCSSEFACGL